MTEPSADPATRIYIDLIGDLFHAGHLRHLEKARSLGGVLVVGVFDDATTERLSHVPVISLEERVAVISALRCVDEVIPAAPARPDMAFLDRYDIDSICLTDDFEDPARQEAMASLLDQGVGIVLPYTEDISTADIVSRVAITETRPRAPVSTGSVIIHPPPATTGTSDSAVLDALGAISAGIFGRSWMLDRERLGDRTWLMLLKCMANNHVARRTHRPVDPRFMAAFVSLADRYARPGDHINLIGNAAEWTGSALAGEDLAVTVLRPGISQPGGQTAAGRSGCNYVYCDVDGLPDASPPADVTVIFEPAWSALLLVDAPLLFEATRRLKRDIIMAFDFWPEDSGSFLPVDRGGTFHFSDSYIRNVLHAQGFFDVEDILTTCEGAPLPDGSAGCARLSRIAMVEGDRVEGGFRYLDGGEVTPIGMAESGKYIRWYRASKISIAPDVE